MTKKDSIDKLHALAAAGDFQQLSQLLKCGADATAYNENQETLAHSVVNGASCQEEAMEMLELIGEYSGELHGQDICGRTPASIAN